MSSALLRELEKDVQSKVYELLIKCGCAVYWLSQPRETRQTPGVPDLLTFHALRGFAFIECKAPEGKQRKAQRVFQELCNAAGIRYILAPSVEPVHPRLGVVVVQGIRAVHETVGRAHDGREIPPCTDVLHSPRSTQRDAG